MPKMLELLFCRLEDDMEFAARRCDEKYDEFAGGG